MSSRESVGKKDRRGWEGSGVECVFAIKRLRVRARAFPELGGCETLSRQHHDQIISYMKPQLAWVLLDGRTIYELSSSPFSFTNASQYIVDQKEVRSERVKTVIIANWPSRIMLMSEIQ